MEQEKRPILCNGELYVSVAMLLFTAVIAWQTSIIKIQESRMLPYCALFLCGISAISLLIKVVACKAEESAPKTLLFGKKEIVVLSLMLLCYFLFEILGFYVSLFLFLVGVSLLMEEKITVKVVCRKVLTNVIFTGILYIGFHILLRIVTPSGLLF